ncbi:hypothetical protein ACGFZS_43375 [Streptomyces sp. NPDC048288]|uniref:hypothetical protein n=1 Tax=Streptomyces sp. NPDC048288 TaxID=3365529 RepID=UPI003711E1FD
MPGFLLHAGATVNCAHSGLATSTGVDARVLLDKSTVIVVGAPYTVTGCSNTVPCISGRWTSGAIRVRVGGLAVVLSVPDSQSECVPTSTPLRAQAGAQTRVRGV